MGGKALSVETVIHSYQCVICNKHCAIPIISPIEKKDMGKEWMVREQSQTEIGGILLCTGCRPAHSKVCIDAYRVYGNVWEKCTCTWDGTKLWLCLVCEAKDRTLESSKSMWESYR